MVIIFEKVIMLLRKRNFNYLPVRDVNVMIPALNGDPVIIEFLDSIKSPITYDSKSTNEIIIEDDLNTRYHITHHILKHNKNIDNISDEELKHLMHYSEYCINENREKSEYIKVYMER